MKKFLVLVLGCFLISCTSVQKEENLLYGPKTSLEKMDTALKNLHFDTMSYADFFVSSNFLGKIETQWKTYYLPGEMLVGFLTGTALDKEIQLKYCITLYSNFYEIQGFYRIINREWSSSLDKNYTVKEIPLERDSKYWFLLEKFADSLQKELANN